MDKKIRHRLDAACVDFPAAGGMGVVLSPDFVLTAAHLLGWSSSGRMALAPEEFLLRMTLAGKSLIVQVGAVEPIADVAVVTAPDSQLVFDDEDGRTICPAEEFEEAVGSAPAPLLFTDDFPPGGMMVHLRTTAKTWMTARADQVRPSSHFARVSSSEPIQGGMSGGPVFTVDGRIVGVISNASGGGFEGWIARPHLALPAWIVRRIA